MPGRDSKSDVLSPTQAYFGRREFLRRSALGALGLSLADLFWLEQSAHAERAQARNVLVILEQGGLSHLDTWDPKPELPGDDRSIYKPISTNVPGLQFTELLAKTARVADKLCVVRGMHHTIGDHPQGTAYILRGNNPRSPLNYPDLGGVVSEVIGSRCSYLPPYIMVPGNHEQAAEASNGFLPPNRAAFKTQGIELSDPKWTVAGLRPAIGDNRLAVRRELLGKLDAPFGHAVASPRLDAVRTAYEQAFNAITSPHARAAFDFTQESEATKEAYGRSHRGFCYLLGRRLVEAGVRFVTVDVRAPKSSVKVDGENLNWDHHDNIYATGTCGRDRVLCGGEGRYGIGTWPMMGSTDQAFAALIEDLHQRGLLAETLVCFVTEFGRTPKINKCAGRDHWPNAFSIAFAGAGVPGGTVIGATDKHGGEVVESPHTPEDYAETIYAKLGIDTEQGMRLPDGRFIPFTQGGKAIAELL